MPASEQLEPNWEQQLIDDFCGDRPADSPDSDGDNEPDQPDQASCPIKSLSQLLQCVSDIKQYCLMHPELSSVLSLQTASEDHIQTEMIRVMSSTRQAKITTFFK